MIGGGKIYEQAINECRYIYETRINHEVECDVFFPKFEYPCVYVSKTRKSGKWIYDHRLYVNKEVMDIEGIDGKALVGEPEHE